MKVWDRLRVLWLIRRDSSIVTGLRSWEPDDTAEWGHRCEVCGGTDVRRSGEWDYCSLGHSYVGKRAQR